MRETILETYHDKEECDSDWETFAEMVKTWANPKRWGVRQDNISDARETGWRLVLVDRESEDE